jgi:hypothetical protein
VLKRTKEVGEFAIKKRGAHALTKTVGVAEKGKGVPTPREDEKEGLNSRAKRSTLQLGIHALCHHMKDLKRSVCS